MRGRRWNFNSRRQVWMLAVWMLLAGGPASAAADGAGLIADVWTRYRNVKSERAEVEILVVKGPQPAPYSRRDAETLLREGPSGVVHKRAVQHVVYAPDMHDKLHILFSLPAEDAGLGLLVARQPSAAQDDMWLFMPGYHRVRRIPASSDQKFAGTDLVYEDVRTSIGERTDDFDYSTPVAEDEDGRPADVVVATPKSGTSSAYARRKIWVDEAWKLPVRVEFYDAQGKLAKVMRHTDVREAASGVRRADLIEMRDLRHDSATLVLVTKRVVGADVPAHVFTEDYLAHPGAD